MLKYFLFTILVAKLCAQTIITRSDPQNITIISPNTKKIMATGPKLSQFGDGAKWIYIVDKRYGGYNSATVILQHLFYADCNDNLILRISAYEKFTAFINEIQIGTGIKLRIYQFNISVACGLNNLTVKVNIFTSNFGALFFVIKQNVDLSNRHIILRSNPDSVSVVSYTDFQQNDRAKVVLSDKNFNNYLFPIDGSIIKNYPNLQGTDAKWIQINTQFSAQQLYIVTFQSIFYGDCSKQAKLITTARSKFNAFLNGELVGSGSDQLRQYVFDIVLNCSANNLTIVVLNGNRGAPGNLIFAVTQQIQPVSTDCYSCSDLGQYNTSICSCQCQKQQICNKGKQWLNYPVCGCKCKNILTCPQNKYFNQKNCKCECLAKKCRRGYVVDKKSCECVCEVRHCENEARWDQNQCKCVVALKPKCKGDESKEEKCVTCRCE